MAADLDAPPPLSLIGEEAEEEALRLAMSSPCIGVCELDAVSGFCRGCGRRGEEIAAWGIFSEAQRQAILAQLPTRLPLTRRRRGGRQTRAPTPA